MNVYFKSIILYNCLFVYSLSAAFVPILNPEYLEIIKDCLNVVNYGSQIDLKFAYWQLDYITNDQNDLVCFLQQDGSFRQMNMNIMFIKKMEILFKVISARILPYYLADSVLFKIFGECKFFLKKLKNGYAYNQQENYFSGLCGLLKVNKDLINWLEDKLTTDLLLMDLVLLGFVIDDLWVSKNIKNSLKNESLKVARNSLKSIFPYQKDFELYLSTEEGLLGVRTQIFEKFKKTIEELGAVSTDEELLSKLASEIQKIDFVLNSFNEDEISDQETFLRNTLSFYSYFYDWLLNLVANYSLHVDLDDKFLTKIEEVIVQVGFILNLNLLVNGFVLDGAEEAMRQQVFKEEQKAFYEIDNFWNKKLSHLNKCSDDTAMCTICYEANLEGLYKTSCNHFFHKECLFKLGDSNSKKKSSIFCPCCRTNIVEEVVLLSHKFETGKILQDYNSIKAMCDDLNLLSSLSEAEQAEMSQLVDLADQRFFIDTQVSLLTEFSDDDSSAGDSNFSSQDDLIQENLSFE